MIKQQIRKLTSIPSMLLFVWIVVFAIYSIAPYSDPDVPWHYAAGLYMLNHFTVPHTDPFSWTMHGVPWIAHEWLFEVVLAYIGKSFGFYGVWGLGIVFQIVLVFVLYRQSLLQSADNRVVAATAVFIGMYAGIAAWVMRPQMISYIMFALFLWMLFTFANGNRYPLVILPLAFVLWANSHGSAVIGVAMVLFEIALSFVPSIAKFEKWSLSWKQRGELALATAIGVGLSILLNPNGILSYTYALYSTNHLIDQYIQEWQSPDFNTVYFKFVFLPLAFLTISVLIGMKKKVPLRGALYFGVTLILTMIHQRFAPYFALTMIPLWAHIGTEISSQLGSPSKIIRVLNGIVILAGLVGVATQLPQGAGSVNQHWSHKSFPIKAVAYMKQHHMTTHVLNIYRWGGYLIDQGIAPFIDGRTDIYLHDNLMKHYMDIQNIQPNIQKYLQSYQVQYVLFPKGSPLTVYLAHQSQWNLVYSSKVAEVFQKAQRGK